MQIIKYYLVDKTWVADFVDDKEVLAAFGQTILPTPFTAQMSAGDVYKALKKQNPNHDIQNWN